MKLPNREHAVIAPDKLFDYILNAKHKRGGTKARLLIEFGYNPVNWRQLESDIRLCHLGTDADSVRQSEYGTRYEIRAALQTPSGRALIVRTIWQVDTGTDYPRLITC